MRSRCCIPALPEEFHSEPYIYTAAPQSPITPGYVISHTNVGEKRSRNRRGATRDGPVSHADKKVCSGRREREREPRDKRGKNKASARLLISGDAVGLRLSDEVQQLGFLVLGGKAGCYLGCLQIVRSDFWKENFGRLKILLIRSLVA